MYVYQKLFTFIFDCLFRFNTSKLYVYVAPFITAMACYKFLFSFCEEPILFYLIVYFHRYSVIDMRPTNFNCFTIFRNIENSSEALLIMNNSAGEPLNLVKRFGAVSNFLQSSAFYSSNVCVVC